MLTRDDKIRQIKTALIKVLSVAKQQFPWLDYKRTKYGRDQSLRDNKGTTVRVYFQPCLDKEGKEIEPFHGFRDAEYYDEIYNTVGQVLTKYFKDDPQIKEIKAGTFSQIVDVPEVDGVLEKSYYGVIININYIRGSDDADAD